MGRMRQTVAVLIVAARLMCPAGAGVEKVPEGGKRPAKAGLIAPDGVRFASEAVRDLMKKKPLSGNLIRNASFEKGKYWPEGWDPVDRLGTHWMDGGTHGKRYVRLYTKMLDAQWVLWNEKVLAIVKEARKKTEGKPQTLPKNPLPDPPKPVLSKPPYYDSVGGISGIHYRSDFIPCKPGAIYRFSVDARTDASGGPGPKVFIKGFIDQKRKTEGGAVVVLKRNAYRAPLNLKGCGKAWKRFAREFHPARSKSTFKGKPIQPEWLRVELYAYWTVGNYDFDNVRLEIVGHEKIVHKAKPQPPAETKPPRELGEDEFPIFK